MILYFVIWETFFCCIDIFSNSFDITVTLCLSGDFRPKIDWILWSKRSRMLTYFPFSCSFMPVPVWHTSHNGGKSDALLLSLFARDLTRSIEWLKLGCLAEIFTNQAALDSRVRSTLTTPAPRSHLEDAAGRDWTHVTTDEGCRYTRLINERPHDVQLCLSERGAMAWGASERGAMAWGASERGAMVSERGAMV